METSSGVSKNLWSALETDPFLVRQSYEQVAARLTGEVRAGRLRNGEKLPGERELARALGVGRPTVREALASLAEVGIVEIRPASGSYVSPVATQLLAAAEQRIAAGPADMSPDALLDARLSFEPMIAERAARTARPDTEVESLLEEMDAVVDLADPLQREAWNDGDRRFHRQLAVLAGSPVLVSMADLIAATMDEPLWRRLRDEAVAVPRRIKLYAAEHRLIYEAVRDGDTKSAAFLARMHLTHVRRDMGLALTENGNTQDADPAPGARASEAAGEVASE